MLNTKEDLSVLSDIQIEALATGCEIDTSSQLFLLIFDTTSAQFNYLLNDTLLSVYEPYIIPKDSFVTDYSRNGLNYDLAVENPSVLSASMTTSEIRFTPLKVGTSQVEVIISDDYTHKNYANHFQIDVYDPLNHAPVENSSAPKNYDVLLNDTLEINLNTLFIDADHDKLTFEYLLSDTTGFNSALKDSSLFIYAGSVAQTECEVTADDQRGGIASTQMNISVNRMPERIQDNTPYLFQYDENCVEIGLDSIFSDPDGDTLSFTVIDSDFPAYPEGDGLIEICPVTSGSGTIRLSISDGRNGILNDSLMMRFNAAPIAAHSEYYLEFTSGNEIIEIDLDTIFNDVDNDHLTYSVLSTSTPILTYDLAESSLILIPGDTLPSHLIAGADDAFGGFDSTYINLVYLHIPLLLNDQQLMNYLIVYPNPAKDKIALLTGNENQIRCDVTLADSWGRIVLRTSLNRHASDAFELNVADKNLKGIYLLRLNSPSGQSLIRKIVFVR